MTNDTQPPGRRPDFIAYQVRDIPGREKSIWTRIGASWMHKDLEGMDIRLDCLPIDGRVSLRSPIEDSEEPGSSESA